MSYTQEEWDGATVFGYGRKGMMTYALDATGRVLVDDTRPGACQVLDYSGKVPPARDASKPGLDWAERVTAAKQALRDDEWPLDGCSK